MTARTRTTRQDIIIIILFHNERSESDLYSSSLCPTHSTVRDHRTMRSTCSWDSMSFLHRSIQWSRRKNPTWERSNWAVNFPLHWSHRSGLLHLWIIRDCCPSDWLYNVHDSRNSKKHFSKSHTTSDDRSSPLCISWSAIAITSRHRSIAFIRALILLLLICLHL